MLAERVAQAGIDQVVQPVAQVPAAAAVRGTPGGVYNIGGGSRVSLRDVFEMIARVSRRPVQIDHQPAQKGDMRRLVRSDRRAA